MEHSWHGGADAAITISFDDGFAQTWQTTVFALHQRGLYGTFHVIPNLVGTPFEGLPTAGWEQWQEAASLGHEIGVHGLDHSPLAGWWSDLRRLIHNYQTVSNPKAYTRQLWVTFQALNRWERPGVSVTQQRRAANSATHLRAARQRIDQALGSSRTESFAYPAGRHSIAARRLVVDAGFTSARSLDLGWNSPTPDRFALRAISLVPGMTIHDLVGWLDAALLARAWLILVFHLVSEINAAGYPYCCAAADFYRLLDTLQSRPVWVATQRQVCRYLTQTEEHAPHTNR